ncbi:MAG: DUF58 domain-containing protein [Lachnospiraceae bacterium]|nr:DUF58 domain-containing protein [Lachnospiraceae bacterium]MCR5768373.1 DUF58 domain-containing protein [Lachnospiraceae bacterium]
MRRNRIIYYILCIAAIVLASLYGGPITYSILFGLLLITPVSFAYLLTVYAFFKLYQVVQSKHISVYEPVPYYFILQNEYLLNFCHIRTDMYTTFSYIEKMPVNKEYELLPYESARYDTRLICRYRGDYKVGIKDITITDYLRLFKITYHVPEPLGVVVAPRIIKLTSLRIENDPARNSFMENPRLSQDFDAAVRDYVPGDPVKGIHQKLSARAGKLKSRLTYGEEKQGIAIFLDTDRISIDEYKFIPVENKCLEIVLALANYFAAFSITTTMKYYRSGASDGSSPEKGKQIRLEELKCRGLDEMERFLGETSTVQFRDNGDSWQAARMISKDPVFRNCLVAFLVVTGTCAQLNETLNELSMSGVHCVIYYVGYEPDTSEILPLQNQTVIPVHPEDDLQKVM